MTRYAPLLCLLAIVGLAGCRSIADQKWPIACEQPAHPASGVRVIQIDEGTSEEDPGEFFDASDLVGLETWLKKSQDAPIVVYVHGWHNNATDEKPNLPAFRSFMCELEADICEVATAKRGSRPACPGVQGVYVGWRGDSLDPWILPDILDFGTFPGRMQASVHVGKGDLRKVLGLVTGFEDRYVFIVGHSLGAQAIYHTLPDPLQVAKKHNYVLLNPAITSLAFKRQFQLLLGTQGQGAREASATELESARNRIAERQHRKIVVMQTGSDWVVGGLFSFVYGRAIGFDKSRRTHTAEAAPIDFCPAFRSVPLPNLCEIKLESGLTFHAFDPHISCEISFAAPVWFVSVNSSVSESHGDIWGPVQRCALAELISKRVNEIEYF